jgi:hypothetical protein
MTNDQLAKELRELKRRRETPFPLIEMFDGLLSLALGLSAKPKRKRSDEIMATHWNGWNARTPDRNWTLAGRPAHSSHHWPRQPFPSGLSGSSAPGVAAAP